MGLFGFAGSYPPAAKAAVWVPSPKAYILGEFKSLNHIKNAWRKDKEFIPKIDKKLRNHLLQGWQQAIKKTLA